MALSHPYLASNESAARRRSAALHRMIAVAPFLLLLAVGLVGHIRRPVPNAKGDLTRYDALVLAYRDRVVGAQAALGEGGAPSETAIRKEAKRWTEGYASGELRPVTPAYFEDHLRDGARGEIVRAGLSLSLALALQVDRRAEGSRAREAASDAILAAEIAQGVRGFEMQSYVQSLVAQRRALGLLSTTWPKLRPAERAAFVPRLRSLLRDPREAEALGAHEGALVRDYLARQGDEPAMGNAATRMLVDREVAVSRRGTAWSNARINDLLSR